MKEAKYSADGGAICIGSGKCQSCFPNGYGDGEFTVYVIENEEERKQNNFYKDWRWVGSVQGTKIRVYNYDCYSNKEELKENIVFELSGRYGIYVNEGNVVLVNWGI